MHFIGSAQHPSLLLRHVIPNSEKQVPTPAICVVQMDFASGLYLAPFPAPARIGVRLIDNSRGIILVTESANPDVLSHEWRHHWQYHQGIRYDGIGWKESAPYWDQIEAFFRNSWCEMDALLFSWRRSGFIHDAWRDALEICNPK